MKNSIYLFLACFTFMSCGTSQDVKAITTKELKTLLSNKKIQLLDVRTPTEVKDGFIESSLFADFYDTNFKTKAMEILNKDEPVYIYCRTGNRSEKSSEILQEKGYKVYNVLGGYTQWQKEN